MLRMRYDLTACLSIYAVALRYYGHTLGWYMPALFGARQDSMLCSP